MNCEPQMDTYFDDFDYPYNYGGYVSKQLTKKTLR